LVAQGRARYTVRVLSGLATQEIEAAVADRRQPAGSLDPQQQRARRLRTALEELGPLYIKIGQSRSTRPDFVPQYVMDEMAQLHDRASATPFSDFVPALRTELGDNWRDRFESFHWQTPLGAASLAQVYRATLADGRPCVVKIQRPGAMTAVTGDMKVLQRVASLVRAAAPGFTATFDLGAMLEILFRAMEDELDFTREAHNQKYARKLARDYSRLHVPKVITATPRVMIQSLVDGESVGHLKPNEHTKSARRKMATELLRFMFHGYFTDRFFHADPHPGNVLVTSDGRAHLIDWGMIGRVDRSTGSALLGVFLAVARNDGPEVARQWMSLGNATAKSDVPAFIGDISRQVPHWSEASLKELNFGVALTSVLKYSSRRGIQSTPMVSVVGKSLANAEGSLRHLYPKLKISEVLRTVLPEIVQDLVKDMVTFEQASQYTLDLLHTAQRAPGDFQRVATDLSDQAFTVRTRDSITNAASPSLLRAVASPVVHSLTSLRHLGAGKPS
jgi:ubiquinone biosynthesis protein